MRRKIRSMVAAVVLALLALGCAGQVEEVKHSVKEPFSLEKIGDTKISRVRVTAEAVKRLDITTSKVLEVKTAKGVRKTITQAALIYDKKGDTWTYTSPEPLLYVRQAIVIETIDEDGLVYLTKGPPAGTKVVIVGAAELYGMETGVK